MSTTCYGHYRLLLPPLPHHLQKEYKPYILTFNGQVSRWLPYLTTCGIFKPPPPREPKSATQVHH